MTNGPSEMVMLSAGLIVAALVSGVLLGAWEDMSEAIDDRGEQSSELTRTRASMVNDPSNIQWDNTGKTTTIFLQNSGDTFLDVNTVGVFLAGHSMTVSSVGSPTQWLPGEIIEFNIEDQTSSPHDYTVDTDASLSFTVISDAEQYAGSYSNTEGVRLVPA
ncbi:MAG: hypothetical protein CMA12_05500 [Euryarchaeota archaeon]|nr:hypothetical protein [Euryarchaeota archaeon]OUW22281.1 MAG: hypothetical protein CBD33_03360 [Euryarchaeota archaeon TMED173]